MTMNDSSTVSASPSLDTCLIEYARTLWRSEWRAENLFCGDLCKQAKGSYYKRWDKRWMVLRPDALFYFKDQQEENPMGVLFLDGSTVIEDVSRALGVRHGIGITVNSACSMDSNKAFQRRSYYFTAESSIEFDAWIEAFGKALGMEAILPASDPPPLPPPTAIDAPPIDGVFPVDSTTADMHRRPMSISNPVALGDLAAMNLIPLRNPSITDASLYSTESYGSLPTNVTRHGTTLTGYTSWSQETRYQSGRQSYQTTADDLNDQESFDCAVDASTASRTLSTSLYNAFVEAHNQISNFSSRISTINAHSFDHTHPPIDYADAVTAVIRSVRHLLYFADGKFKKSMQNSDLAACFSKFMSSVIDSSRTMGNLAQRLMEDDCVGAEHRERLESMVSCAETMSHRVHSFVSAAKSLSFLDAALVRLQDGQFSPEFLNALADVQRCVVSLARSMVGENLVVQQTAYDDLVGLAGRVADASRQHVDPLLLALRKVSLKELRKHGRIALDGAALPSIVSHLDESARDFAASNIQEADMAALMQMSTAILRVLATIAVVEQHLLTPQVKNGIWDVVADNAVPQSPIDCMPAVFDLEPSPGELPPPLAEHAQSGLTSSLTRLRLRGNSGDNLRTETNRQSCIVGSEKSELTWKRPDLTVVTGLASDVVASEFSPIMHSTESPETEVNDLTIEQLVFHIMAPLSELQQCLTTRMSEAISESMVTLVSGISDWSQTLQGRLNDESAADETPKNTQHQELCDKFSLVVTQLKGSTSLDELKQHSADLLDICRDLLQSIHSVAPSSIAVPVRAPSTSAPASTFSLSKSFPTLSRLRSFRYSARSSTTIPPTPPISPRPRQRDSTMSENSTRSSISTENYDEADVTAVNRVMEEEDAAFEAHSDLCIRDDGKGPRVVKGGTLKKLVDYLTYYKYPSSEFTAAFLLTYRSFTTASDLLVLLINRYDSISPPDTLNDAQVNLYKRRKIIPTRLRVLNILKMWMKNHDEDFSCTQLLLNVRTFIAGAHEDFTQAAADIDKLITRLARRPSEPTIPDECMRKHSLTLSSRFAVVDLDPIDLARQITLMQAEIFCKIRPSECLDQAWNRKELHDQSPNIRKMIKFSNFLVQWVATEIVAGETFKSRAYLIKRFVQLADRLRSMNNFDGLKSVVCGLQMSGIMRLRRSWELLSTKYQTLFEELTQLMSEERSCKAYRAVLQTAQPPCIPFLGVYLTDLTMIDSGNSDTCKDQPQMINFHKRLLLAQVMQDIRRFQCGQYDFVKNAALWEWLEQEPARNPQEVYEMSLVAEPREPSTTE